MISKEIKSKILNYYDKKEDKIFAGAIIDKVNKFETSNYMVCTNFLNMKEKEIAVSILNKQDINYYLFNPLKDTERTVIFIFPEYLDIEEILYKYITVIKVVPKVKGKITHREYMGTIYSLGLREDMIGDIFVCNDSCYLFCLKQIEKYILNNLSKVAKTEVNLESLDLYSKEVKSIKLNLKHMEVIIPSLRVDVILSEVFCLSRSEVKTKIQNGDLCINAKEMFFVAYEVKHKDIISFRKCGKFKIGNVLRNTKSGKFVLTIDKYN